MKRFILPALFFVALLSIWHLLVLAKVWSVVLLPDPISVWEYLKVLPKMGRFCKHRLSQCAAFWLATSSALRPACRSGC
jgi:ABC-type nitrate/sulfonate/bicarbonate transport system permease component